MKAKEYCYKAVLNPRYILYIGNVFGAYHVFVTDEKHTLNYSVYGGYRTIGAAENRLLKSAASYKSNEIKYSYTTRKNLLKYGAFEIESAGEGMK